MVRIKLDLPPDSTFLSEVIYEGLMFLILKTRCEFNPKEINAGSDCLNRAYSSLDDERIGNIRIVMSGNDNINAKIFEKLGLSNVKSRKTYYDLINLLKEHSSSIKSKEEVNIELKAFKKDVLMDLNNKNEGISAPQLFKVDRYTGISSLDTDYTSQQLTFYFSKEIALISLLGVYSSFVISVRQQQHSYYYFLFFSPDEIVNLLNSEKLVDKFFTIKDTVAEEFRKILSRSTLNELLLTEITLNVELQRLMENENLEKVSLLLFKIAPEGQTYKIYEQISLTIYRNPAFYRIAEKYSHNAISFCEQLGRAVSSDVILRTLSSLNTKNKHSEADNILKAIQMLYRFVVLGDPQGWFGFLRELHNSHAKLVNSSDGRERRRAENYLRLVKSISYA